MNGGDVPTPPFGFDWDSRKYIQNLKKHSIRFDDVVHVFADPRGFDIELQHVEGEVRWVWLGNLYGVVLYTVYTLRDEDETTRLISSRRATRLETDAHYEGA